MSEANWRVDRTEISVTEFILKEEKELSVMFVWLRDLLNTLCTDRTQGGRCQNMKKRKKRKKKIDHTETEAELLRNCMSKCPG